MDRKKMYAMTLDTCFQHIDSTVPQNYSVHPVDKNLVSSRMKYFRMLIVAFPLKILDFVETASKKSIFFFFHIQVKTDF